MQEGYCGHSFTACKLGCRRQHNALAHDELSERIISTTPVSEGGGRRSAALNRGERVGGRQRKGEKHIQERGKQKCPLHRVDFSRAPMLEHSSELALVQSLYANSMRCPPSAAGISVRTEDLPMRYVGVGPTFNLGYLLWSCPYLDCFFVWAEYCHRMYCFQLRRSPMLCDCVTVGRVVFFRCPYKAFFFSRSPKTMYLNVIKIGYSYQSHPP